MADVGGSPFFTHQWIGPSGTLDTGVGWMVALVMVRPQGMVSRGALGKPITLDPHFTQPSIAGVPDTGAQALFVDLTSVTSQEDVPQP